MYTHVITATEAARSFSLLLNKVVAKGQAFDIQRGSEVIAKLLPIKGLNTLAVDELNDFFAKLPPLEKEEWQDFSNDLEKYRRKLKLLDKNPWD